LYLCGRGSGRSGDGQKCAAIHIIWLSLTLQSAGGYIIHEGRYFVTPR